MKLRRYRGWDWEELVDILGCKKEQKQYNNLPAKDWIDSKLLSDAMKKSLNSWAERPNSKKKTKVIKSVRMFMKLLSKSSIILIESGQEHVDIFNIEDNEEFLKSVAINLETLWN